MEMTIKVMEGHIEGTGGDKWHKKDEEIPLIRKKKTKQMTLTETLPTLPPPPSWSQITPPGSASESVTIASLGFGSFDPYGSNLNLPNLANLIW